MTILNNTVLNTENMLEEWILGPLIAHTEKW